MKLVEHIATFFLFFFNLKIIGEIESISVNKSKKKYALYLVIIQFF